MNSAWQGLLIFLLLLLGNGFFVAAEFGLISARRAQLEPRAKAGSRPAKITIKAMEQVSLMLATSQIGVTVCSLLILLIAEPSIHELLSGPLEAAGLEAEATAAVTLVISIVLVTVLHVLVGELVPKQFAFAIPERAALVLVPVLFGLAWVLKPIVVALNSTANGILRLFGVKAVSEANSAFTLEQVEDIVQHSTREGVLSDSSGALGNTFEFTEKQVHDIRVPLTKVVSVPETVTPAQLEEMVVKHGFSRYPVVSDDGEALNYLHLKDVLDIAAKNPNKPVEAKRWHDMPAIAESVELEDALAFLRARNAHIARSVDRAGNTTGVLFLEDIIEELVGEVRDATRRRQ
ncbi:MAG: hypothetical protein RL670_79 [Actinomycetota bacterium]|jgi:CBS domain containing-hemolysin-like protein